MAACALAVTALLLGLSPEAAAQDTLRVTAQAESLRIELPGLASGRAILIEERRPFELDAEGASISPVWNGQASGAAVEVPRFAAGRDRLFSRFEVVDVGTRVVLAGPRWVDAGPEVAERFEIPGRREGAGAPAGGGRGAPRPPLPRASGKKGLQCIVDIDDAIALGIGHAAHNLQLGGVLDLGEGDPEKLDPELSRTVDGVRVGLRRSAVERLDATLSKLAAAGVESTIILLNAVPRELPAADRRLERALIHPSTDLAGAPNGLGAFNLTSEAGYRLYRGAIELLAERYTRPGAPHGSITGFIIGNEIQAHWWWHNMGLRAAEDVIRDYARAVRVAHLACAKAHPDLRVHVSMDHHWTARMVEDPLRFLPGKEVLDRFAALARAEGDYPWAVAFHPYPENLFDPRSWEDAHAPRSFDAPKITFKNVEVLPAYLDGILGGIEGGGAPESARRRVILSEQGFHGPPGEDAEALQAAAYAWAFRRIDAIDGIDAFILHRHVDHAGEGGLKLGLWTAREGTWSTPGRRKPIHDVFRAAGTAAEPEAFAFALPIVGLSDWTEVIPSPMPLPPQVERAPARPAEPLLDLSGARLAASSEQDGFGAGGAADGHRFRLAGGGLWKGKPGTGPWWWEARWSSPRPAGALLQVLGDEMDLFANAPLRYVWQWSPDGERWIDLEETRTRRERRLFRIHRLQAPVPAFALRLSIEAAEGDAPALREVEVYSEPDAVIAFPPWALAVATDESRNLDDARAFIRLAREIPAGRRLPFQRVWLDAFDVQMVRAEPRPLCAFLTGNYRDWCERTREPWRGALEILQARALPIWASCGGAQGLAILSEHGIEQPWDCPHCRDPGSSRAAIYGHIEGCKGTRCGDYSDCVHERGPTRIARARPDSILEGLPAEFEAMESHCGEIRRVPKGWILAARGGPGAKTAVQCIRLEDAPIYAAQFHIEMEGTPDTARSARAILGRFLETARGFHSR